MSDDEKPQQNDFGIIRSVWKTQGAIASGVQVKITNKTTLKEFTTKVKDDYVTNR